MRELATRFYDGCLGTFASLFRFEFDGLTFHKLLEAVHLDGGVVHEHILTTILRTNEAIALGLVEPFHCANTHIETYTLKK